MFIFEQLIKSISGLLNQTPARYLMNTGVENEFSLRCALLLVSFIFITRLCLKSVNAWSLPSCHHSDEMKSFVVCFVCIFFNVIKTTKNSAGICHDAFTKKVNTFFARLNSLFQFNKSSKTGFRKECYASKRKKTKIKIPINSTSICQKRVVFYKSAFDR